MLGAASYDDCKCLGLFASGDEGHGFSANEPLVDKLRESEIGSLHLEYVPYEASAGSPCKVLHVRLLQAPADEDSGLGEVMLHEVVHALLAEYDVGAGGNDLVHQALEIGLFLVEEGLHRHWVGYADLGVHLGLLVLKCDRDQCYLGVADGFGHTGVHPLLVDDDTLNEVRVPDHSADLLLYPYVVCVDLSVVAFDRPYGFDDDVRQVTLLAAHGFTH